jgi:microcystin-dependent protein
MAISQNQALFSLLGTTYGGDGRTTFGLPDLRGRVPISFGSSNDGNSYALGEKAGEETHTLIGAEMPPHSHALLSSSAAGNTATPSPSVHLATSNVSGKNLYAPVASVQAYDVLKPCVSTVGGLPHENMMPSLAMNFCISLTGVYPSRN